jgi:crotonobetainyl-CoA:carnitine CoA-transferase CaiB-like acyl-CoA transferase
LLADAGADVIKIEDTESGDYAREMPPTTDEGISTLFGAVNRGKRSVALDLKSDGGRTAFYDLLEGADVVVESFRPGVAGRLGVDYDAVSERQSDIVYCSLTGYGQDGPYADRPSHDLNCIGLSGLLDMNRRDVDEAPRLPGYQIADIGGGLLAAFAVCSALLSRELGNSGGEYLDVSMTDAVVAFSQAVAPDALRGGAPRPGQTPLTGEYPCYGVYEASDGNYVTFGALEPKFFEAFCAAIDRPELADEHMSDDPAVRAALRAELESIFAERTRDEWVSSLADVDTAFGGVYTPEEALEHPQIEARGYVRGPDDGAPRVGFPVRGSDVPRQDGRDLPGHGEHTEAVLKAAGYDAEAVARLKSDSAIR